MSRIIFSLFILWGYLSNSLGGSRPGSFPLREYVPPTLSSWCDTLHSSQIIAHSPHRARHQPQDQNTDTTPSTHREHRQQRQRPGADHEPHQQNHSPGELPPILCGSMGDPQTPAARGAVSVEKTNTEIKTRLRVKNYKKCIDIYTLSC